MANENGEFVFNPGNREMKPIRHRPGPMAGPGPMDGPGPMAEAPIMRPKRMTEERLKKANETLERYKSAKAQHDERVVENERWYRQRHWEFIHGNDGEEDRMLRTETPWLFNGLNVLHSDAMDAYPRLNVLPREQEDEEEAKRLSSIIPVVLKQNEFKSTYSENTWRKGRSGTGVYGVFWNKEKLHGLGDIEIAAVDVLNVFWEPGKKDLQKSANVFHVEMMDREAVRAQYPQIDDKAVQDQGIKPRQYINEESASHQADKVAVVDWYYKAKRPDGRSVLHYCKYVNLTVLYASEDDYEAMEGQEPPAVRGWYDHGLYPFEFDAFYPIEGSPAGFGLLDVNKNTQEQVDLMQSSITLNTLMRAYPRYAGRSDGGVNIEDFMNWRKPFIEYEGNSLQDSMEPIVIPDMPATCVQVLNNTVEMLKQTSGASDFSTGRTTGGVTAYSAIAALIETSGKNVKAFSEGSYRAFERIGLMVIELIRQFYDFPRQFRIEGKAGEEQFITYSNERLKRQTMGTMTAQGEAMYRTPLFDLEIATERESTYTRLARNELAKELMGMGVFSPQNVDQSLMMLDMMDFDGKEKLMSKLREMGTMADMLAYFQQIALELAQRYDPAMAEQIAGVIMQQAQSAGMIPATGNANGPENHVTQDPTTGELKREHANGAKARGMVQSATMPNG